MTGSTVDGALDLTARARQHRPADRATLRAAALELRAHGLTPIDIAKRRWAHLSALCVICGRCPMSELLHFVYWLSLHIRRRAPREISP